ncbi:MAG TPA: pilus assembly protein TadG-related protein [Acidimicrobiia bacterium]|nr:pilus assembly protein TadG-related protein [Acidimicrobiia bacterium]
MTPRDAAERGTITLWLLGLCMMLLLLGGISLDLWRGFSARRSLTSAADAAAVAGATALDTAAYRATGAVRLDPAEAERRARASLRDQLDTRALRDARVLADTTGVTVELQGDVAFTLLQLADPGGDLPITVRSTARPRPSG